MIEMFRIENTGRHQSANTKLLLVKTKIMATK